MDNFLGGVLLICIAFISGYIVIINIITVIVYAEEYSMDSETTKLPSEAFFSRPGLEKMPQLDYRSMRWVNVCEFGARRDGKQYCNHAFIRALESLQPKGGVIFIPAGIYKFRPPQSSKDAYWRPRIDGEPIRNIHFVGEGESTVLRFEKTRSLASDSMPYGLHFGSAKNLSIYNLRCDIRPYLDQRWPPLKGIYPILFSKADNIQIMKVIIDQAGMGLAFWDGCKDIWVVDCVIRNTCADSVHFAGSKNAVAAYNIIENSGDDSFGAITYKGHSRVENVRIIHNTIIGGRWGRGITVMGGKQCEVTNNWVEQTVGTGIFIAGHSHSRDRHGLQPIEDLQVADNTVVRTSLLERKDNPLPGHRRGGSIVLIGEVINTHITNNRVYGGERDGIHIESVRGSSFKGRNIKIQGNEISRNLEQGFVCALREESSLIGLAFERNRLYKNKDEAVFICGKLQDVYFYDNVLNPVFELGEQSVNISSQGISIPEDGIRLTNEDSSYRDDYAEARMVDRESSWEDSPDIQVNPELPVFDIKKLGAVGNGKTNDATVFLKAIKQLSDGGIIRIPAGTYLLKPLEGQDELPFTRIRHHVLFSDLKDIHIMGAGLEKTNLVFDSSQHQGLRFINVRNFSVSDLTLSIKEHPSYRTNRALLDISACETGQLVNVAVVDSGGSGIQIDSSRHILVRDCTAKNAGTNGINILSSRQITVESTTVSNSFDNGIYLSYRGSIARAIEYLCIRNNRIMGTQNGFGMALSTGDKVHVINNHIHDTYQAGVMLYQHHSNFWPGRMEIVNNVLSNCGIGKHSITLGAISIVRCKAGDFLIKENRIKKTPQNGIWIAHNVSLERLQLAKNKFEDVLGDVYAFDEEQKKKIKVISDCGLQIKKN